VLLLFIVNIFISPNMVVQYTLEEEND